MMTGTLLENVSEYIRLHPGSTCNTIADYLGVGSPSVRQAVSKLKGRNQIVGRQMQHERANRLSWYWVSDEAKLATLPIVDEELFDRFKRPEGQAPWWADFEA
jgi:hypothetical protein